MPKKIKTPAKKDIKAAKKDDFTEILSEKIHESAEQLSALISHTKEKIAKMDKKDHQKILAGLAGAGLLLAGAIGYKAAKSKSKGKTKKK